MSMLKRPHGQGRRNWQLMFGAVILGLIMQQLLPMRTWDIMRMVGNGLGYLFGSERLPVLTPLPLPAPQPVV